MNVLVDHQTFLYQTSGGISRYHVELMKHAALDSNVQVISSVLASNNIHYRQWRPRTWRLPTLSFKGEMRLYRMIHERVSCFLRPRCDLVHPTFYDPYILTWPSTTPIILTIHDMIPELFPEFFPGADTFISNKRRVLERANHIVSNSEWSKRDLIRLFSIPENKITVTPLAHSMNDIPSRAPACRLPSRYVLFVGKRSGYKNFRRFSEAIAPLLQSENMDLVCCGGGAVTLEEKTILGARIHWIDSVSDEELKFLYEKALCFVYPSLYEGFGIPILEAMSVGCPVALASTSSFPEVAGEAGAYFDPLSVDDMRAVIRNVITHEDERRAWAQKGILQASRYSWSQTYLKTKAVYESVLGRAS